jgi:hypothetical protein
MLKTNKVPTGLIVAALIVLGAAAGSILSALPSSAEANTSGIGTNNVTVEPAVATKTPIGGHVGPNGTREQLLTGDTAYKVKAAALAAVPGGTVQRVETDAEGAVYEAHMSKSDGTQVTVKFDSNFKVTGTETGGPGSHSGNRPNSNMNTN